MDTFALLGFIFGLVGTSFELGVVETEKRPCGFSETDAARLRSSRDVGWRVGSGEGCEASETFEESAPDRLFSEEELRSFSYPLTPLLESSRDVDRIVMSRSIVLRHIGRSLLNDFARLIPFNGAIGVCAYV